LATNCDNDVACLVQKLIVFVMFKEFVQQNGLEFYSTGGDPAKLMAYMVKVDETTSLSHCSGANMIHRTQVSCRRRSLEKQAMWAKDDPRSRKC